MTEDFASNTHFFGNITRGPSLVFSFPERSDVEALKKQLSTLKEEEQTRQVRSQRDEFAKKFNAEQDKLAQELRNEIAAFGEKPCA